ncbi:hypothetical protein ZWY2020_049394 [Hordeum vulgare]|nr:hypothetical protein ZWY2020_049394 [Hordeum vulgare]
MMGTPWPGAKAGSEGRRRDWEPGDYAVHELAGDPVKVDFILQRLPRPANGHALLALSRRLILPDIISSNWSSSDTTPCGWKGVQCEMNIVVHLNLSYSEVSGSIGPEVGRLKYLRQLDLSSNNISGPIPHELGNCVLLDLLDLSGNSLSGGIPASLVNLNKLSQLGLYSNSLSGEIPEGLFKNRFLGSTEVPRLNLRRVKSIFGESSSKLNEVLESTENFDDKYIISTDFGIAKLINLTPADSQTTGIVGTVGYMSPERGGGRVPLPRLRWEDLRADVEANPSFSYHLSPFPTTTASPQPPSSEAWRSFHRRHASGRFFKERRYLLKEFPELLNSKGCAKVLEVGCGNGSTVVPILRSLIAASLQIALNMSTSQVHAKIVRDDFVEVRDQSEGVYDMTMLRFLPHQRVGFREYMRADGTYSYFFSLDTVRELFHAAGLLELELEYCCVRSVNRKNGKNMQRYGCIANLKPTSQ